MAFGYWKLACILQGVYARYVGGAGAGDRSSVDELPRPASAGWPSMAADTLAVRRDPATRRAVTALRACTTDRVLDRPVLVVALEGWVDAGLGAATAAISALLSAPADRAGGHLRRRPLHRPAGPATRRATSSTASTTELTWPVTQMRLGHDQAGADVLLPGRARARLPLAEFVDAVVGLAVRCGVRMVVGLGAFPAPAPHTRPVRLAATAPPASAELVDPGRHRPGRARRAGRACRRPSSWASARPASPPWACGPGSPTTSSAMPFPEASAALVDGLAAVAGLTLDASPLHAAADASRRQVDELIANNAEHTAMVRKLEESDRRRRGQPARGRTAARGRRDRGRARALPARRASEAPAPTTADPCAAPNRRLGCRA